MIILIFLMNFCFSFKKDNSQTMWIYISHFSHVSDIAHKNGHEWTILASNESLQLHPSHLYKVLYKLRVRICLHTHVIFIRSVLNG